MNERSAGSWRTIYPWRARAEIYVTGPMLALVLLQGTAVADTVTSGYWMGAVAKANLMLFILVPLCAVCAAWEGARHRGGGVNELGIARPVWVVAAVAVAPTLVMGVLGVAAAVVSTAPAAVGAPGGPPLGLIGAYLVVMAGHTIVGYGLGRWLPPALALPASLGGSYVWLAYPAAVEPFWIRHLNGLSFESCCSIAYQPDGRAVLATVLFAVGIGVGTLIALGGSRLSRIGGAVSGTALLLVAVTVALPLGPAVGGPRDGAPRCAGQRPTLCLWPEQEQARDVIHPVLASAYSRLGEVGLMLPETVTSDVRAADTKQGNAAEAVFIGPPARPDPQVVVWSLANSFVPDTLPPCAAHGRWPGVDNRAALAVWVALAAGVPASTLDSTAPPELIDLVVRVRQQLDNEQQLAWYRANLVPMGDCTTQPRLDPASFASEQPR
ncbi:hypothetical protein [Salinispora sp. H7-4]|uniref:DUF7224 domain-containing protein n=1 Tax=Salinispora sp. H7-4 TaxID=2748321 RepID=UPI0015D303B2|nr:hypothetical protein [Salinispora sp. H7-4]NYT94260.1 hypothetical protein [Salinispora sp. H7-4]